MPPERAHQRQEEEAQHDGAGDPPRLGEHPLQLAHGAHKEEGGADGDDVAQGVEDAEGVEVERQAEHDARQDGDERAWKERVVLFKC